MSAEVTLPDVSGAVVGVIGGTGAQGRGLAYRLARVGQHVLIGSRDSERAQRAVAELAALLPEGPAGREHRLEGTDNDDVAERADILIVAVPFDGHRATAEALRAHVRGKVVVDCVNPVGFDKRGAYPLEVTEGSAAEQAQAVLPESTVVGAFHHVSAVLLADPEIDTIDTDVLVLGDVREATDTVQALAARIPGMRGIYAGRLRNCRQIEALTANLISVNRRYKAHAGLRVTDV